MLGMLQNHAFIVEYLIAKFFYFTNKRFVVDASNIPQKGKNAMS